VWDFSTGFVVGLDHPEETPGTFALYQNFPNPFNPSTEIMYDLAQPATVMVSIHDLLGRSVRSLVSGPQSAGRYLVRWDGNDDKRRSVASGYLSVPAAGPPKSERRRRAGEPAFCELRRADGMVLADKKTGAVEMNWGRAGIEEVPN
jgi:FlgD Ig-like domain